MLGFTLSKNLPMVFYIFLNFITMPNLLSSLEIGSIFNPQGKQKHDRIFQVGWGWWGALPHPHSNGLMFERQFILSRLVYTQKSSPSCDLAVPEPRALHSLNNVYGIFHLGKISKTTTSLLSNPQSWLYRWHPRNHLDLFPSLPWTGCWCALRWNSQFLPIEGRCDMTNKSPE